MNAKRRSRTAIGPEALEVGRNIKAARKRLGLTGRDVHARAGIDPTTLSFLERGVREARWNHLRALSLAFGVPVTTLLGSTLGLSVESVKPSARVRNRRHAAKRTP